MWTLYFSHFFTSFPIGLCRICLPAEVCHLVFICSLLVGIDCVTDWRLQSLEWKTHSFVLKFSPQNAEDRILGLWKFKKFLGQNTPKPPPHPPRKRGLMALCSYSWLLYSNLLATSSFYWNPSILLQQCICNHYSTKNQMIDREICLSHYGAFIIRVIFWGCVLRYLYLCKRLIQAVWLVK